jgi:FKBP-type peptidyl-prolyl cis-trans isomerase FkpA
MKRFFKYALPGFLLLSIFVACEKEYESIEALDSRNVQAYIQQNKLNLTQFQNTGMYYEVITPGTGPDLAFSDQVPMIFTIRSTDGKYIAADTLALSNRYYNYLGYFNLEVVRNGLKEVLKKSSGTMRMVIPSRLAFGRNGASGVDGNTPIDMTVKVLDRSKIPAYEDFAIKKYMADKSLTGFTKTNSGLYYKIADAGTGSPIAVDSTITTEYTGKLINGVVFDKTNAGTPASFVLSSLVQGWQEAVPLIKQGGTIQFILPSSIGYGLEGTTAIPPFSVLDFTVKITDVAP